MLRFIMTLLIPFSLFSSTVAFTATFHWQNPYVGVYLGGSIGNNQLSTSAGSVTSSSYFNTPVDINAVNSAGSFNQTPSAIIAGFQMGHDWMKKQFVYGISADYGVLPLKSSATVNATDSVYSSLSSKWLFTLRGRVGYLVMQRIPTLFYATGGMAITQLKMNNNYSDNSSLAGRGGNTLSVNQIGWAAGAGIEFATFDHFTLDVEYLYVQVPSVTMTSSISNSVAGFGIPLHSLTSPFTSTGKFNTSLLRLGFNYRIDE